MVQNYCYINKWIIKNNYPLPLISENQDIRRKDERYIGLADSKRSQRHTEIFRIGNLLSTVHQRFCSDSQTIT